MDTAARIYLDPKRSRPSSHVHITAMGIHEVMPQGMRRYTAPDYPFLLMLFHRPAYVIDDSGARQAAGGKMILWPMGAMHHYGNPESEWDHSWLQLRGAWAQHMIPTGGVPLGKLLDLPHGEGALRCLQFLYDELYSRPAQDPDMVEGILRLLWLELGRALAAEESAHYQDERLEAARRYIEAHYAGAFELDRCAEEACLSRSHFCYRFARQYGIPPLEYAMRLRLHRAANLLGNPELAIYQVAEMVGYTDALYFSRVFRKRYGMSPRAYRQVPHQH